MPSPVDMFPWMKWTFCTWARLPRHCSWDPPAYPLDGVDREVVPLSLVVFPAGGGEVLRVEVAVRLSAVVVEGRPLAGDQDGAVMPRRASLLGRPRPQTLDPLQHAVWHRDARQARLVKRAQRLRNKPPANTNTDTIAGRCRNIYKSC